MGKKAKKMKKIEQNYYVKAIQNHNDQILDMIASLTELMNIPDMNMELFRGLAAHEILRQKDFIFTDDYFDTIAEITGKAMTFDKVYGFKPKQPIPDNINFDGFAYYD